MVLLLASRDHDGDEDDNAVIVVTMFGKGARGCWIEEDDNVGSMQSITVIVWSRLKSITLDVGLAQTI